MDNVGLEEEELSVPDMWLVLKAKETHELTLQDYEEKEGGPKREQENTNTRKDKGELCCPLFSSAFLKYPWAKT